MSQCVSVKSSLRFLATMAIVCCAVVFAQQPAQAQEQGARPAAGGGGQTRPGAVVAPLFLKVEWVRPSSQTGQVPVIQENILDPNVQMIWYGPGAKQLLTTGTPGSDVTPFGVWSGACEAPFAITFKLKSSYADLTGLANVRWFVKTSGFHEVRPVVKLPDGTLLVADLSFTAVPMLVESEFSLQGLRWLKLDPDRIVTLGRTPAPNNETWVPDPDLSKVDEVGFVDLMPGSGHGTGGYIQLGQIEVFAKAVPRDAASISGKNK